MPKMKTNKGAAKRLRATGSGKIVHKNAWNVHLKKSKSASRKSRLKGMKQVSRADERAARTLLVR